MEERGNNKGGLREKSFNLALRLIKMCRYIREERREFGITKQLLKSGTNPGAMVRESEYAETGADFIHKLGIAQKELNETRYWIDLLYAADFIQESEFRSVMEDVDEVMRLLTSSIKTRKQNLKKQ